MMNLIRHKHDITEANVGQDCKYSGMIDAGYLESVQVMRHGSVYKPS